MEWTAKLEKIRNNDFIQELSNKILPIDSKLDDVLDKIDRFLQNTKKKFYIDRYGINNTLRLLKYDEFGKEKHIYFNDLSTGEKVIFTLAILQVSQSFKFDTELQVLLIDEFDAYLNPELSELLIETLKTQFIDKGVQVIFATHSPSTVAHAIKYGAKIQWMEDSKFVNKDNDKIISLLSNGLILLQDSSDTINLLYQGLNEKNNIIFVEGKTDKIHIESAIEKLGYKEKFNDIFIIHDNGEQLDSYIDLTMQIIFKKENKKFIAILDHDNAGYAMKEKINKKNPTVDVFLLPIIDDFKDYVDKFKEKKFYQPIEFYFDKSILDENELITENHDYFNILKGTIDEKKTIILPKLLKYKIKADDNKNETGDKVKFAEYMQTNGTAEDYKNFKPLLNQIYSLLY